MKKLFLFLATVLLVGLTAQAMLTEPVTFQGLKQTVNNTSYFSWQIQSVWGQASLANRQGSSYTFSNTNLGWSPVNCSVNGTLNFQEATAYTDVVTSGTFTVTFNCTTLWFDAATVKTSSGGAVTGCTTQVSSDKHTVTVTIPSGKTFGQIALDYVPNAPLTSSNTTISGLAADYIYRGSAIEPVPTVTSGGRMLTAGIDYTVSYSGSNSVGTATLTVTGTGNYTGTVTKNYTIRNIALSDFRSLGSNTYEIATTTDLDNLAALVDVAENNCNGITFRQTADIAYSITGLGDTGENFATIGGYFNGSDKNFCGTYDGQGHTISGIRLYKNGTGAQSMNQGLFGRINTGATIKNVILADARITGYRYVGGLVGNKVAGTVQNCLVLNSTITCADKYVGAICGKNTGTLTANYYHNCTVNGTAGATNVGAGGNGGVSASSDLNGARSVHALTLPDGVTATGESVTIGGATYYAANTTVTLAYNNAAYNATYSVNGNAITGSTFTMPAADATVTVTTTAVNYSITYDLAGGALPSGQSNPTTYNVETATFTLINPIRDGYTFDGWTGSNGTTPQTTVTISTGSTGDLNYTAKWTRLPRYYTFDSETGALSLIWGEFNKDNKWGDEVVISNVKSVTATNEVIFTGDCSSLFSNFTKCDSMDLSDVNTSQMTNAYRMFFHCSRLTSLDISGWNTANVTNMSEMFYDCTGLTSLDLLGWNTANVTNMSEMFYACGDLTSLDVSGFNTGNVTDMSEMFYLCLGLTSLDLSGWNTANVTNMGSMFHYCSGLDSLDLSGWNTANVNTMASMFEGCSGLTTLDLSGWNNGNVTSMRSMFYGCSGLTTLDLSGFSTANVDIMEYMFYGCSDLTSLDLSGFNTANVEFMGWMFYGCSGLDSLDLSGWNTGKVYSMAYMFFGCSSLDSLDLSGWNTANVYSMVYMFFGCSGLTSLDLSGWNTANVRYMEYMFNGCSGLTTIYAGEDWSTESVIGSTDMFLGCTNLKGGMGTTYDESHTGARYARIDKGDDKPGYLTGVFTLTLGEGVTATATATLTHGDVSLYAAGTTVTLAYNGELPQDHIIYCVNGTPIKGNTFEMPFEDVIVTAELQPRYTFDSETGALTLIWGEFNKDNKWGSDVTNTAVKSVNATSEVIFTGDCSYLFSECSHCESMDLSNVNTSEMTNCYCMFYNCQRLDSLNLSGWNTSGVTNMNSMFYACTGLTSLDVSGFNTGNVTDMSEMFYGCRGLTSLDLSGWNTANVTNMGSMFSYCSGLDSLDLSGWNTGNVTTMRGMFQSCSALITLDVSGWNTANATSMRSMFYGCSGLTSLDLSGWNNAKVEDMYGMFEGCSGLDSLDLSGWNTGNVTVMNSMFYRCSSMTSLDLSGWNTANVTNMRQMFQGCSKLTTIYAGDDWTNEGVTNSYNMFWGCTKLKGGMGTTYNESNPMDKTYARIDGGTDNPGYFTEKVNYLRGDVNGDNNVSIADVTALIDYLLSGDPSAINTDAADCNQDNGVSIADVTALIDYLLSGQWP